MIDFFDVSGRIATAGLRLFPAEVAHDLAIYAMEHGYVRYLPKPKPRDYVVPLQVDVPGIGPLKHPVGLAAGFDKDARCPEAFEYLGLSFLELGTITPRPQEGNPKPRLFRDPETRSIINRMGFNSIGAERVSKKLAALKWPPTRVPIGINIGKNKNTPPEAAIEDYFFGVEKFQSQSTWITINISSPNTPGLRSFATPEFIKNLAFTINEFKNRCWIKLDPDMNKKTFQNLIETITDCEFRGVILCNTHKVEWPHTGGQSGHPLLSPSNTCLEWATEASKARLPMIASGGVLSGIDAFHKLARGASAVQIYTALVYRGPAAAHKICEELSHELKLRGFDSAEEAIGSWYHS
jgi:dihydroorotate dehydrogenase